ncbi:hypothetical protein AX16_002894 [Volvariella volvacea WC 439]|nr:hypothetical protein AX16_002894 [Volvariella volvacea WC 439]
MPGTKRAAAEEAGTGATTRSAKAAKTDTATTPAKGKRGGGRKAAKTPLPATAFKSKAKPLHIHLSHTAPAEGEDAAEKDPGHLAYLALVPSSFNTGSYGWKGSKRISIELPNPEGEEEKEKVTVMLRCEFFQEKRADGF